MIECATCVGRSGCVRERRLVCGGVGREGTTLTIEIGPQAEVVSKVQGELAAHVAALEEKKEVAEVVEDVVDFEDYMADPTGQPVTITGTCV